MKPFGLPVGTVRAIAMLAFVLGEIALIAVGNIEGAKELSPFTGVAMTYYFQERSKAAA